MDYRPRVRETEIPYLESTKCKEPEEPNTDREKLETETKENRRGKDTHKREKNKHRRERNKHRRGEDGKYSYEQ